MSEPSTTTTHSTPRPTNLFWVACLALFALLAIFPEQAKAAKELRSVAVADPYLEMHTGPGRGYPIFHVVDRGESIDIIKQRTDWFLVRDADGDEGWVDRGLEEFTNSKWEIGVLAGDFGGANTVSLYGAYSLNPHVSLEVWGSQILGNFSNGWTASVNVVHETWPDWRVSPFFTLGAGVIRTEPKSTIIQARLRDAAIPVPGGIQDSRCIHEP
jgi:hypothetical protein